MLDLLVFTAVLCGIVSLFFLPDTIDTRNQYHEGVMLLTVGPALVGVIVLLGVRAILRPGPGSRTATRAVAVLLCMTVVLLPVGGAILVGLLRARPGVWRYGPASRWVALLLLAPLLAWAALDLGIALNTGSRKYLPATSALSAIVLAGASGVLLHRAWARPIARAAALLTGLTGAGLPLALPALVLLRRGGSRAPLEVPSVWNLAEPPPAREPHPPSSLFTIVTALTCVGVYLAEVDPGSLAYALFGAGPAPTLVTVGAVNGPAIARGEVWRILTAGYLHAGVLHLSLNLIALLVAGMYVERRYGHVRTAIVYMGSMVVGNLLAAVLSAPGSYTVGASGAIMGLFAAMVTAGARFRSERHSLVRAGTVVLTTLVYGLLHHGVSNAAHVGGLVAGVWLATVIGTDPAWTAFVRRREWNQLVASQHDRRKAIGHLRPPTVVADPTNRVVLRMSGPQRRRWWALAPLFPLVFLADVVYLVTIGRPPAGAELGFAGLCLLMALPSPVIVLGTFGRLELTAHGFRQVTPLMPSRFVLWIDVDAGFFPEEIYFVKFVSYQLTPAAQASSFFGSATQRVRVYGMDATEQALLMNDWGRRWRY